MSRSFKKGVSNALMARLSGVIRSETDLPIPSLIGRYRVLSTIGSGASAVVYLAEDLQLGRKVAIKVLNPGADDAFIRRFHREASLAANVRRGGIVTIHEVAMVRRADGSPVHFLVMDYYQRSLEDVLDEGGLTIRERVMLLQQVARAIHHAHEMGVIHRDIKPGNILIDHEGAPVVGDFGLAREESQVTRMTRSGAPVGTPAYMSPEQVAGDLDAIGPRSDLYSLGIVLYRLITDQVPFDGMSPGQVYAAILTDPPSRPRDHSTAVDRELETICLKAIQKDPRLRYDSAREFAEDLRRWLAGESVIARAPSPFMRFRRSLRGKGAWISGAAGLLVAAIIALVFVPRWMDASQSARDAEMEMRRRELAELKRLKDREQARPYIEEGRRVIERMRLRMTKPDYSADEMKRLAEEAEKHFRDALNWNPSDAEPLVQIGQALLLSGQKAGALAVIDEALKKDPSNGRAYLDRVRIRIADYERYRHMSGGAVREETIETRDLRRQIEDDLQKVGVHSTRSVDLLYARALLAFAEGDYEDCAATLAEYLETTPTDGEAWYWRGHALIHLDRDGEAAAALTRAIEYDARNARYFHSRAMARSGLSQFKEAISDYTKVVELEPDFSSAWHNRGLILSLLGDNDKALSDLTEAIKLLPADADHWARRAEIRDEMQDNQGALVDYSMAIQLSPNDVELRLKRGTVYLELEMLSRAVHDFSAVLRARPKHSLAWFNRGLALQKNGKLAEALTDYTMAIRSDSRNVDALVNRGNVKKALGDVDGALEDFNKAITAHKDPDAFVNRGIIHAQRGDYERAVLDYSSAIDIRPQSAQTFINRGIAYLSLDRPADAEKDFSRAIQLEPGWGTGY